MNYKKYFLISDYVIAWLLMAHKQISMVRNIKFYSSRMIFIFKRADEFMSLYNKIRKREIAVL